MGPIAVILCLWFVVHLFRADARENPDASAALFVPLTWMFLAGSRYVSSWLSLGGPATSGSYDEGSPIDAATFFTLIAAGAIILYRRRLQWGQVLSGNKLLAFYLLFCFVSLLWADAPFVSLKRWVKDLGNPIMALLILTDPQPLQSLCLVLRRLSYLLLPLSILFVRYYPDLGRDYRADGSPMFTGVGHQKNDLGLMCLVTGIYFAWQLILDRKNFRSWGVRGAGGCGYSSQWLPGCCGCRTVRPPWQRSWSLCASFGPPVCTSSNAARRGWSAYWCSAPCCYCLYRPPST